MQGKFSVSPCGREEGVGINYSCQLFMTSVQEGVYCLEKPNHAGGYLILTTPSSYMYCCCSYPNLSFNICPNGTDTHPLP